MFHSHQEAKQVVFGRLDQRATMEKSQKCEKKSQKRFKKSTLLTLPHLNTNGIGSISGADFSFQNTHNHEVLVAFSMLSMY